MSPASGAPEPITLRYWGNEFDVLAYEQIEDFERLHDGSDGKPAIRVSMGQTASVDRTGDSQRLLCAIAGGDPPDVVWFDRYAVAEWAARGAFVSLQDFYDQDLEERPDDPSTLHEAQFYAPCWEEACFEGELFAVPTDADNRALFYNVDLLEKYSEELMGVGCTDPSDPTKVGPPRDWEQLKAASRIMTERDGSGRLIQVGFIPNFGNSWLYIYGWLNGARFLSEDGRECLLDSEPIVEALAFMTEIYEGMGGAKEAMAFQSSASGTDIDPFFAGKVAMRIDCGALIGVAANYKPDLRLGCVLAPAPEGKPALGWSGGFALVIPKGARHPEAAWTFMKHMASQRAYQLRCEAQREMAQAGGNVFIPEIAGRQDLTDWAMETYVYGNAEVSPMYVAAKRVVVESMPWSKIRPVSPVAQLLWTQHVRAADDGIYLRYDPDPVENARIALARADHEVQAALGQVYGEPPGREISWTPVVASYVVLLAAALFVLVVVWGRRAGPVRGIFGRERFAAYAFASPWFVGFAVFGGGPILFSLVMSFCRYNVFSAPRFVGLGNFADLLADRVFYVSLWNTAYMALGIPLGMAVGLGLAMLLNAEKRGMGLYRTLYYLPAIMPFVAASILWVWIFNPQQGVLNVMLRPVLDLVGLAPPAWLQDPAWSKPAMILMGLWGAGGGMLIWLAGLKGIPTHLYEAAALDGAGPIRRFYHVTLPMLSPYILFNAIMGLIGTFQIFAQAFIMTQGGPVDSTLFYAYALFNNAFRYLRMGYASAMAWILFAIVLLLTIAQLYVSRRWVHYQGD